MPALLFWLTTSYSAFSNCLPQECNSPLNYLHHNLLQHWARLIVRAEKPNPLSSRDGKLLRRVPLEGRLDLAEMARNLEAVLPFKLKQESIQLLLQAWSTGELCEVCIYVIHVSELHVLKHAKRTLGKAVLCPAGKLPGRATLALMRSYAYLQGCCWDQALKDAKFAAAHGPQADGSSCWLSALAAIAAAIEGKQVCHLWCFPTAPSQ